MFSVYGWVVDEMPLLIHFFYFELDSVTSGLDGIVKICTFIEDKSPLSPLHFYRLNKIKIKQ